MIRQDWSTLKKLMFLKAAAGGAAAVEETATGNPLIFLTDLDRPLKSLLIPFTPKQEGSGDPSPTNVRDIVPWNGLTVKHGGANLLLTAEILFGKWINGSGVISNDGRGAITSKIKVESSNVYTLTYNGERPLSLAAVEYNESDTFVRRNYIDTDATGTDEITFSTSASTKTVVCEIYTRVGDMTEAVLDSMKWQFEKGSRTDYNDTVTDTDISFPSPVYGGTLDAVTGVLTVYFAGFSAKWKDGRNESDRGTVTRKQFTVPFTAVQATSTTLAFCNIAKWKWNFESDDLHFYVNATNAYVFLPNGTDGETEIQIVAQLATPQTIQLTPSQITTIVGDNTIWSDADGSMTAIYIKKG